MPFSGPTNSVGRFAAAMFCVVGIGCGIFSCGGGGGGGGSSASTTSTTSGTTTSTTAGGTTGTTTPETKAQLGKALFFDTTLSNPPGQACATCHVQAKVFTDPRPGPTSQGAVAGRFGFRQAPSICYMAYSPTFQASTGLGNNAAGGQFWDGRAATLEDQAKSPLVTNFEMNNATPAAVVAKVQNGPSAAGMKAIYGASIFSDTTTAFNAIVSAIATFERTPAISPFSSKYDAFLKGKVQLTATEIAGLTAFNGKGGCSGCHTSSPTPDGTPPLFTNFCYANLGLPKNPNNPFYKMPASINSAGAAFVDIGLQKTTGRASDAGNFMTPSLRNVAVTAPYFHNGIFATLQQVVHFYNTRDLGGFPAPEVPQTEDKTELGNLGLTATEEADIVAFLGTLTDGYTITSP